MKHKRLLVMFQMLTYSLGQVIVTSLVLAMIQSVGLLISFYLLLQNQSTEEQDPSQNICVEALLCLLFRYGPDSSQTGDTWPGLAGQMLYSLLAISVNLLLLCGAMWRMPSMLLPWLVVYGVAAVLGNLVLVILVPLTIVFRYREEGDVDLIDTLLTIVPFLLLIVYSVLWALVCRVFKRFRKEREALIVVNA